jgi:hypothetical protein
MATHNDEYLAQCGQDKPCKQGEEVYDQQHGKYCCPVTDARGAGAMPAQPASPVNPFGNVRGGR